MTPKADCLETTPKPPIKKETSKMEIIFFLGVDRLLNIPISKEGSFFVLRWIWIFDLSCSSPEDPRSSLFAQWGFSISHLRLIGSNNLILTTPILSSSRFSLSSSLPSVCSLTDSSSRNRGKRLIFGKGHDSKYFEVDKRLKKLMKFKESAWKFVYFLSAELLALSVTYDEPWFTDTKSFWEGPGDQRWPDLKMKQDIKIVLQFCVIRFMPRLLGDVDAISAYLICRLKLKGHYVCCWILYILNLCSTFLGNAA